MADAYDLLRFAIRGHGAVRLRVLRAAEALCKGDPSPEEVVPLLDEFDLAHQRLVGTLDLVARHGPAPLPLIPQPAYVKGR